jgi:hypothetical protein
LLCRDILEEIDYCGLAIEGETSSFLNAIAPTQEVANVLCPVGVVVVGVLDTYINNKQTHF